MSRLYIPVSSPNYDGETSVNYVGLTESDVERIVFLSSFVQSCNSLQAVHTLFVMFPHDLSFFSNEDDSGDDSEDDEKGLEYRFGTDDIGRGQVYIVYQIDPPDMNYSYIRVYFDGDVVLLGTTDGADTTTFKTNVMDIGWLIEKAKTVFEKEK